MAKYTSSPYYNVEKNDREGKSVVSVKFDAAGEYETSDKTEIEVLDSLAPTYVVKVEDVKKPAKGDK